ASRFGDHDQRVNVTRYGDRIGQKFDGRKIEENIFVLLSALRKKLVHVARSQQVFRNSGILFSLFLVGQELLTQFCASQKGIVRSGAVALHVLTMGNAKIEVEKECAATGGAE